MIHFPQFADVVLPLAIGQCYTYRVPRDMALNLREGMRVVVPLGERKYYTGLVVRLHDEPPALDAAQLKDIEEQIDLMPLLLPVHFKFWKWMADYYMCTPGEVMKAALPTGMKLESETMVRRTEEFDDIEALTRREQQAFFSLKKEKAIRTNQLQKELGGNVLAVVRSLMEKGAAEVEERMLRRFKPHTEKHVRLGKDFRKEEALQSCFHERRLPPKQEQLLLGFLQEVMPSYMEGEEALAASSDLEKKQIMARTYYSESAFHSLCKKGILEQFDVEVGRLKYQKVLPELLQKQLSEQQQMALHKILEVFRTKDICLLHGVTSSGKTEVYTKLMQQTLNEGKQVLYLLPEIALTTQIMQRLGKVFGNKLLVYHSKFPDNERVEVWKLIQNGRNENNSRRISTSKSPKEALAAALAEEANIVLGVRSSIFLPFRSLGLIIVDEEHETSYKQTEPAPRYNARDAALMLAQMHGAKVLLGTATPSLETYSRAKSGKYGLVEMKTRFGGIEMPEIVVENVKELRRKKLMKSPFSPRLIQEIRSALENKEQVILFQNRRGYSPVLECHTCGWTPRCTKCDVTLTYHQARREGFQKGSTLVCHYCGAVYNVPEQCPQCEGTELRDIGCGTEKIEATVKQMFPTARTLRMDLDTTRSRSAYERIIKDFAGGKTDILIGTQMVTKGLDFERVRVVGILNADQMLNASDFRAHERAFQMMSQVAGRAGRRGKRGLVVLQTTQAELPVVGNVVNADYEAMYCNEMEERTLFHFPPTVKLINIYIRHKDENICKHAAAELAQILSRFFTAEELLGPEKPYVGRVQLLYIRKMMLKVRPRLSPMSVRRTLQAAKEVITSQDKFKSVNIHFDADPC